MCDSCHLIKILYFSYMFAVKHGSSVVTRGLYSCRSSLRLCWPPSVTCSLVSCLLLILSCVIQVYQDNCNNNNTICIAPLGRNFRSAGCLMWTLQICDVKRNIKRVLVWHISVSAWNITTHLFCHMITLKIQWNVSFPRQFTGGH